MICRIALCRLLSILAVVGLVLAPLTAPQVGMSGVMASGGAQLSMHHAGEADAAMTNMAEAMPCCPPEKPAIPDCQKACPLAAMCLAKCFGGLTTSDVVPFRIGFLNAMILGDDSAPESLAQAPPPRPPRA